MPTKQLRSYRDLDVWKLARRLVKDIYLVTQKLPKDERFGLISQIRSAVISVPANIAEGYARTHRGDYLHHLSIARGSLYEVENYLILILDLEFVSRDDIAPAWHTLDEAGALLWKLIQSLKAPTKMK